MGVELAGMHEGGCHCGAVRYRAEIPVGAVVRRCNCSICSMKGVLMVDVPLEHLHVTEGADVLGLYTFGSHEAKHRFCPRCGIHVFHQTRSDPDKYGINAATLDGVSPYDFAEVPVFDGVNHPGDTGVSRYAGTMRFEPTKD
jgi:hypothetical protein